MREHSLTAGRSLALQRIYRAARALISWQSYVSCGKNNQSSGCFYPRAWYEQAVVVLGKAVITNKKTSQREVFLLAPAAWFEQATNRLTADCSTAELSRNNKCGNEWILEAGTGIEPMYKDLQSSAWATLPTGQSGYLNLSSSFTQRPLYIQTF